MRRVVVSSVARIAGLEHEALTGCLDLAAQGLEPLKLERSAWATGDYVLGRLKGPPPAGLRCELPTGRMANLGAGDLVLGALGHRTATLEVVGSWRAVEDDLVLEMLTSAGLMGRSTSRCTEVVPDLIRMDYAGHLARGGSPLRMRQFAITSDPTPFLIPTVLVVGSSMSAGKTTTAAILVHELCRMGRRVAAAKLTGAARYRDALTMADAGAEWAFDFVDAGLPSTVASPDDYRAAVSELLGHMASLPADIAIIEAGASPLEPYNGAMAMELLEPAVRCQVLCASDPYAVVGIASAFARKPDLVCGPTANTEAGIALVEKLAGVTALDPRRQSSLPTLRALLGRVLEVSPA